MEHSNRKYKVAKLILIVIGIAILGPIILGAVNFYGASHAATPNNTPSSAQNQPNQSIHVNAPVSYADAVALAAPAVVSIKTTKEVPVEVDPVFRYFFGDQNGNDLRNPNGAQREQPKEIMQGIGSGVIVSDKGYILTNNHVVKETNTVVVTLADGRSADGQVVGTDPDTDLAVLKIKLDKLPIITLGSSEKLRVGDVVLAIGNPFGFDKTVTQGIISATERAGNDIGLLANLIQTDAAINPGNSGGALIDAYGRLVGINTAVFTRSGGYQGIGFAIPIDQATEVMNQLIQGKQIKRGYLGVSLQALNKEIRDSVNYKEGEGAYIRAIVNGSPAQKAGLLPGDIVTKINKIAVKDDRAALRVVSGLKPGESYPIEIYRKGEHMTFSVLLGDRVHPKPQQLPEQSDQP